MSQFVPLRLCTLLVLLAFPTGFGAWLPAQTESPSKPAPTAAAKASPLPEATLQAAAPPPTAKELREAQIAADTEKLYQLAQQLKVELDKSNKDMLSLAVVKKAAEIEKLAHSISERMKSN